MNSRISQRLLNMISFLFVHVKTLTIIIIYLRLKAFLLTFWHYDECNTADLFKKVMNFVEFGFLSHGYCISCQNDVLTCRYHWLKQTFATRSEIVLRVRDISPVDAPTKSIDGKEISARFEMQVLKIHLWVTYQEETCKTGKLRNTRFPTRIRCRC